MTAGNTAKVASLYGLKSLMLVPTGLGVSSLFSCCQSRLFLCVMLPSVLVEAKLLFLLKCSVPQSSPQQTSEDSVSLSGELVLLCTYLQRPPGGRNSGPLCVKGKFAALPSSLLYFCSSECGLKLCGSMKVFSQHWEHAGLFLMMMRAHRIPPHRIQVNSKNGRDTTDCNQH